MKSRQYLITIISLLILSFFNINVFATVDSQTIHDLRTQWAIAKYQTSKNKQAAQFAHLIEKAKTLNEQNPQNAQLKVWYATILSSDAAAKGGISVIPELKKAKVLLDEAIQIDNAVEHGFAHGVLGALYARVPAWPIAFGNKKKAREHLELAIKLDPQGSDANYYYGDYLVDVGEYITARKHLELAQRAPIRQEFEIQDRGRKGEIAMSLTKLHRLGH